MIIGRQNSYQNGEKRHKDFEDKKSEILKGIRHDLAECMSDVEFETHVISIGENE